MSKFTLLLLFSILTLNAFTCDLPVIKRQPNDIYVCYGRTVVIQSLFKDTTDLTLQWERSDDNGSTWVPIGSGEGFSFFGEQTMRVDSVTTTNVTWQFRCVGTNPCGSTMSKEVRLIHATNNQLTMTPVGEEFDLVLGDTLWLEASGATYYDWTQFNSSYMTDSEGARIGFFPMESGEYELTGTFLRCVSSTSIDTNFNGIPCDWVRDDTSFFCNNAIYTDTCRLCNPCFNGNGESNSGADSKKLPFKICVGGRITAEFDDIPPICAGEAAPSLPGTSNNGVSGTWFPSFVDNTSTGLYQFTPTSGCAFGTSLVVTVGPPAPVTFTFVDTYCPGATIPPLPDYSNEGIQGYWSPAIDNYNTTNYTFMPHPGYCALSTDRTITILKDTILPNFSLPTSLCKGDFASPLNNTSENAIAGNWIPAVIDNINDGTYSFTPDGGQCALTTTQSITIQEPTNNLPTDSVTYCAGTSFTIIDVVGPEYCQWLPATIDFNNSASYTVIGCSGLCVQSGVVHIKIVQPEIITIESNSPVCNGETVIISSTEHPGTYYWTGTSGSSYGGSEVILPYAGFDKAGKYILYFSNGICETTGEIDIVVNPVPNVTLNDFPTLCANYDAIPLTQGSPAGGQYSYESVQITNFNPQITGAGTFPIKYTYSNGKCSNWATKDIYVKQCVGLSEIDEQFILYPNPTNGMVTIESTVVLDQLFVSDQSGKIILEQAVGGKMNYTLDVSSIANGHYFVDLRSSDKLTRMKISVIH